MPFFFKRPIPKNPTKIPHYVTPHLKFINGAYPLSATTNPTKDDVFPQVFVPISPQTRRLAPVCENNANARTYNESAGT